MPHLIVLAGVPGSGKSTWISRYIQDSDEDYTVVSTDSLIEARAAEVGKTYNDVFGDYIKTATQLMDSAVNEARQRGDNVIWDQTNLSVKKRAAILARFPGWSTTAVNFHISEATLAVRRRNPDRAGKTIPAGVLASMAENYVPASHGEGFDMVIDIGENDD